MLYAERSLGAASQSNSATVQKLDHAVTDRTAVASYLTREYWRLGSDTLLDELSWDRTPVDTMAQYHHDQQANRLSRAASPLWLRQAQQALGDQKAAYEAQADLQMMERG